MACEFARQFDTDFDPALDASFFEGDIWTDHLFGDVDLEAPLELDALKDPLEPLEGLALPSPMANQPWEAPFPQASPEADVVLPLELELGPLSGEAPRPDTPSSWVVEDAPKKKHGRGQRALSEGLVEGTTGGTGDVDTSIRRETAAFLAEDETEPSPTRRVRSKTAPRISFQRADPSALRATRPERRAARREAATRRRALLIAALRASGKNPDDYPMLNPANWTLKGEADDVETDEHEAATRHTVTGSEEGDSASDARQDPRSKREARLARNRASACRSRQRKKQQMDTLRALLNHREQECARLRKENARLRAALGLSATEASPAGSLNSATTLDHESVSPLALPRSHRSKRSRAGDSSEEEYMEDEDDAVFAPPASESGPSRHRPRRAAAAAAVAAFTADDGSTISSASPFSDEEERSRAVEVRAPPSKRRRVGRRGAAFLSAGLAIVAVVLSVLQNPLTFPSSSSAGGSSTSGARSGVGGTGRMLMSAEESGAASTLSVEPPVMWSPMGFALVATGAKELALAILLVLTGFALVAVLAGWLHMEDEEEEAKEKEAKEANEAPARLRAPSRHRGWDLGSWLNSPLPTE